MQEDVLYKVIKGSSCNTVEIGDRIFLRDGLVQIKHETFIGLPFRKDDPNWQKILSQIEIEVDEEYYKQKMFEHKAEILRIVNILRYGGKPFHDTRESG